MNEDDRGDLQFSFNAYEESIKNVQDQILALEKSTFEFKEKMNTE